MQIDTLTSLLTQDNELLIVWGIAVALLLAGLFLIWPTLCSGLRDRRLQKKIRAVGADVLHQVVISDGLDGAMYLENLLLTPDGLLVLPVHRYQGVVFAADGIDNWTQVLGNRTYKFPNPLPQLQSEVLAVKNYATQTPVEGRVVFIPGVGFPKGRPDKLLSMDELDTLAEQNRTREVPPAYWQSWESLKRQVMTPEVSRLREEYAVEKDPAFNARALAGTLMLLLAVVWVGAYYLLS
ncbi:nuclease-related domain-containing protein [Thiohalophilus sp.]|uniref:nuclease-related domain-containing protein n=1 Tax=Thiohalophilus sp. TaxID=3028392 RepID=UPI002ACD51C4|nr:nuclease-related domain-containing protein [Thiohalophilus sp.]MDZ7662200.1 nuclease-related domain-containing protein [Thiohalophilus sp.]